MDDQEDLFVPMLGTKPGTKEQGQSPGSGKWIPRCLELTLIDPLALGLRGTEDCAFHERPQSFALWPAILPRGPLCHPIPLLHSPICLPEPPHCRMFWGSPYLFTPDRESTTSQRSKSSQICCGEPVSLLGLVTGAWAIQATASSERSHHSTGDDSQKWPPWSSLHNLKTAPLRSLAPQQLLTASVTSEGARICTRVAIEATQVLLFSHHLPYWGFCCCFGYNFCVHPFLPHECSTHRDQKRAMNPLEL